jgi:hypothetical protein
MAIGEDWFPVSCRRKPMMVFRKSQVVSSYGRLVQVRFGPADLVYRKSCKNFALDL